MARPTASIGGSIPGPACRSTPLRRPDDSGSERGPEQTHPKRRRHPVIVCPQALHPDLDLPATRERWFHRDSGVVDGAVMARTWLSIRVELVDGMHAPDLWPRPGRILAARPGMTFRMLAEAINDAFARWDRSHLHAFTMADGTRIGIRTPWDELDTQDLDDTQEKLSRLALGERFAFEFDLGDSWMHLCSVGEEKVDPTEVYGEAPDRPVPYFGWGAIPDQYGRRWDGDDGESPPPPQPDPPLSDLPDLHYTWGSRAFRMRPPDAAGDPGMDADVIAGPWSGTPGAVASERPSAHPWTSEDVRELRGAVYRRDATAMIDVLTPRSAIEVAHLAGPGLLAAIDTGNDPARRIAAQLMGELADRLWSGDQELADEFERALLGTGPDLRPVPIDLNELATHLDTVSDYGEGWVLELATGSFWPSDPVMMSGEEEPEGFDDPDRFTPVIGWGSSVGYGDMRDFITTVTDERLAELLWVAIDGKGAFRRFRDVVYDDEQLATNWTRFSSERWLGRARAWLADAGLRPATPQD